MGWEDILSTFNNDNEDSGGFNFNSLLKPKTHTDYNPRWENPISQSNEANTMPSGTDYLKLLRENMQPKTNPSDFYNPKDQDVIDYRAAVNQKPKAESFLEDYISSRPSREDYKPSIWRTIGSALTGFASGYAADDPSLGAKNAMGLYYGPLEDKLADWKAKGEMASTRAKLLDSAEKRSLDNMKYNLDQKYRGAVAASRADSNNNRFAGLVTNSAINTEGRKAKEDQDRTEFNRQQELRDSNARATAAERELSHRDRADRLAFDRERAEWEQTHPRENAHDARAQDPSEILKQDAAATSLALREIYQIPGGDVFKPIIDNMRAAVQENQDPMSALDSMQLDPKIKQYFLNTLKSIKNRYMSGGR